MSRGHYLAGEVVKRFVAEGVEARPGGSIRTMTVLFAHIAGITGLSERMGDRIVPLFGVYFDHMSREICARNGTIGKCIGGRLMAFWGAPSANSDHAADACHAALACRRALRQSGLKDDEGRPIRVCIGINSGDMPVGNIGSEPRLGHTVTGSAADIASLLEGVNVQYGTEILIGEETRQLAVEHSHVRELDLLTVHGRPGGVRIYELLAITENGAAPPNWVSLYEAGLAAYRSDNFTGAMTYFQMVLAVRERDEPSHVMIERCRKLIETPPSDDWESATAPFAKQVPG
jgi:adenylate cyclase